MKVAIPTWQGRISPVFDSAQTLTVFEIDGGPPKSRVEIPITRSFPQARVALLTENSVDVLVCGAITTLLANMCTTSGVTVIPWVCGTVEEVLAAFIADQLPRPDLTMPGCCGQRLRVRQRNRGGRGHGQGGQSRGAGRGCGTGGRGRGRGGSNSW